MTKYLICYTDEEQKGIYYGYRVPTLMVLAVVELIFLVMLLICLAEARHFAGKNGRQIPVKETIKKERLIPTNERKEKEKSVPMDEAKENGQP